MAERTRKLIRYILFYMIAVMAILTGLLSYHTFEEVKRQRAFALLSGFQTALLTSIHHLAEIQETLPKNTLTPYSGTHAYNLEQHIGKLKQPAIKQMYARVNPLFAQLEEEITQANQEFSQTGQYPSSEHLVTLLKEIKSELWKLNGSTEWSFDTLMHNSFAIIYIEQLIVQLIDNLKEQRTQFLQVGKADTNQLHHLNQTVHSLRQQAKNIVSNNPLPMRFKENFAHMEAHFIDYSALYPEFLLSPGKVKQEMARLTTLLELEFHQFFHRLSNYNVETIGAEGRWYLFKSIGLATALLLLIGFFIYLAYLFRAQVTQPLVLLHAGLAGDRESFTACMRSNTDAGKLARLVELHQRKDQRASSKFLVVLSHELYTAINSIIGYSELLEEVSEEKEIPHKIRLSAGYLMDLTSSLVDYALLDTGAMEIQRETVGVAQMMEEIESVIWPSMHANNNNLTLEIEEGVESLYTDPTKLKEAILNILQNAAKYTHDGSVALKCSQDADNTYFVVKDTGRGIPKGDLAKIFDAFTSAHRAGDEGMGLGLSIAERLCLLMGGKIVIESEEGQGTEVSVILPRHPQNQSC